MLKLGWNAQFGYLCRSLEFAFRVFPLSRFASNLALRQSAQHLSSRGDFIRGVDGCHDRNHLWMGKDL